jgi:hypothetical protein
MKEIPLTRGLIALVDDDDFERLQRHKWTATKGHTGNTWYAYHQEIKSGKMAVVKMHREILGIKDKKIDVDHKDRDGLNNQKCNLRCCTRSENLCNMVRCNPSGYKGVSLHHRKKKWVAKIQINGKQIYLGIFDNKEDAALAYDRGAIKYHKEFGRLNFVHKEAI